MKKAVAAQLRADLSKYLSNHPGWHTTETIAKAIDQSPRTTGQILGGMARNGLIPLPEVKGNKKSWCWRTGEPAPQEGPSPKPRTTAPVAKAEEIEIVINGIEIVAGRNPKTGRIRITIEDTK